VKHATLLFILIVASSLRGQDFSWHYSGNLPILPYSDGGFVDEILTCPHDTMLACKEYDGRSQLIFLSTDHGTSWEDTKRWMPSIGHTIVTPEGALIHWSIGGNNHDSGIHISYDYGKNWKSLLKGVPITDLVQGKSGQLIALVNNKNESVLYISIDGGLSWLAEQLKFFVNAIALSPQGVIFIALDDTIKSSTNYGQSWNTVFISDAITTFGGGRDYIYVITNDAHLYVANYSQEKIWKDRGQSFYWDENIHDNGRSILTSSSISVDSGKTWKGYEFLGSNFPRPQRASAIAIDSQGWYFVASGSYIIVSNGSGSQWQVRSPLLREGSSVVGMNLIGSRENFYATNNGKLYVSSDRGRSWSQQYGPTLTSIDIGFDDSLISSGEDEHYKYFIKTDNGTSFLPNEVLYLANTAFSKIIAIDVLGKCHYTNDNGKSWNSAFITSDTITSFYTVGIDTLYVGIRGSLFYSYDGGREWKEQKIPGSPVISFIASSPDGSLIAVFDSVVIWKSTDEGITWTMWSENLPNAKIHGLAKTFDGSLYAATEQGVFRLIAGASSWDSFMHGLTDPVVLSISPWGNDLIVSCLNTEIFTTENYLSVKNITSKDDLEVFPNPASNEITIQYDIQKNESISLSLCDLSGREMFTLSSGFENIGLHSSLYLLNNIPSGFYYCILNKSGKIERKEIIIRK
jgi:photosystem II stability/assembly factor-like uncharacterized protein